jgi:hypothetical protein
MDMPATIEELLEAVFSVQYNLRIYSESEWEKWFIHELIASQLPYSENVSTEVEESPWLAAVT